MRDVEIPGGTATLRDREDMKMRHRRIVEIASIEASPAVAKARTALVPDPAKPGEMKLDPEKANKIVYTASEAAAMLQAQDATIIAILHSWTLDEPLPTVDTIGDISPGVYDALSAATKDDGADLLVGETNFEESPDRERPTGSSLSSNGSSPEELSEPESELIPTSALDGESTSIEGSTEG